MRRAFRVRRFSRRSEIGMDGDGAGRRPRALEGSPSVKRNRRFIIRTASLPSGDLAAQHVEPGPVGSSSKA